MQMIINGTLADASDGNTFEVTNPANGLLVDTVPDASNADVERCLAAASAARRLWRDTPLPQRAEIIRKWVALILEKRQELAVLHSREMGKPINEAFGEIGDCADVAGSYVERALHMYEIIMPESGGLEKDLIFTRREPLGVVLCIIPFNYPAYILAHKITPALLMGNTVIVKPPSTNPLLDCRLAALLAEAGVPAGVIQILTGSGARLSEKLIPDSRIHAVAMTGSTEVGIDVAAKSASTLHRVMLELGGNDPMIVFDDADLDLAVEEAYNGRIVNAGQTCCAPKRFIVQKGVKDAFVAKLKAKLEATKVGDPADTSNRMGCLVSEKAAIECEKSVEHTIKQGAKLVCGGKRYDKTFYAPTLLDNVTADMDVARDLEIFGPVFPVIAFETEQEAVDIANQTIFGLNGGVVTRDIARGMRVIAQMECGTTVINGSGNYRHKDHAFGGYKMTGYGREGISATLEEMSQVKTCFLRKVF